MINAIMVDALFVFLGFVVADEINLEAGDGAENTIAGKGNQQSRQQANPRQSQRAGDQYFNTAETTLQGINWKLNEHGQQIFQLNFLMDDIPSKVQDLRASDKDQDGRLDRLERAMSTVITVKPAQGIVEITNKPIPEDIKPDDKLSLRAILTILGVAAILIALLAGAVVYLAVPHG